MNSLQQRGTRTLPPGGFVVLVLIALIGLTVSVRARQVEHALHGSRVSPVSAKTDLTSPAFLDCEPKQDSTVALPPVREAVRFPFGGSEAQPRVAPQPAMYSVAVRHRPPPAFQA